MCRTWKKNAERGGIGVGGTYLRVGEERQGSNAFDTMSGRCFDPAFLEKSARWEQHRRGRTCQSFRVSSTKRMARHVNQRQQRQFTRCKCQVSRQARSSQPRKTQDERWTKSSGNRRTALPLFFWLYSAPNNGAGDSDTGEFKSSRRGTEARGRQSAARGKVSIATWRIVEWEVLHLGKNKNNQGPGREDPSTSERHSQDQETAD